MNRITIDPGIHIWLLAGTVEELRNHGVAVPSRVDEIMQRSLPMVNVPRFLNGEFRGLRTEAVGLLEALEVPDELAGVHYDKLVHEGLDDVSSSLRVKTTHFLEDRILGVGLKSYPFVVDWNRNGKKDLMVGDHDGFIYLYENIGTDDAPVLGDAKRLQCDDRNIDFKSFANPKISIAKFCGDDREFMVLGNYGGKIPIYPNRGGAGPYRFSLKDMFWARTEAGPIDLGNYVYPQTFDWNGNGLHDLVVGTIEGPIYLFLNTGNRQEPVFDDKVPIEGIETLMYPHPTFADMNGNGLPDLLLGHREGTVLLYENVGAPGQPEFESRGPLSKEDGKPVEVFLLSHQCATDWNNDGRIDLLVGNDSGQVVLFRNVGTPARPVYDDGEMLKDNGGELISGVHPITSYVDWDGDGDLDLVVGHQEQVIRLFRNSGSRTEPRFDGFEELNEIVCDRKTLAARDPATAPYWDNEALLFNTEYLGNLAPSFVDWDGSGRPDLLLGNYAGLVYRFKRAAGRGDARFEPGEPLFCGGAPMRVAGFSTPIAVDWNNNGRLDIVCGDFLGRIHVYLNSGQGRDPVFDKHFMIRIDGQPVRIAARSIVEVADVDGDGRKDILVGHRWGGVFALLNKGTDAVPVFEKVERPVDESTEVWEQLYGSTRYGPGQEEAREVFPGLKNPHPLHTLETSCPRVLDWDGDGEAEWLVSQRYGRVFVVRPIGAR